MRESLARHRATPPSTRWLLLLPPFPYVRIVLHKGRLKGTRGETRIVGKTREARNNHPIIKSLTRLRLLLSVVYLRTLSARLPRGLDYPTEGVYEFMNFASYISPAASPVTSLLASLALRESTTKLARARESNKTLLIEHFSFYSRVFERFTESQSRTQREKYLT